MKSLDTNITNQLKGRELDPKIAGFSFKTFEAQITKRLGPAFFEAVKKSDFKAADAAIANAISNTTLGGPTGSAAAQVNSEIKTMLEDGVIVQGNEDASLL